MSIADEIRKRIPKWRRSAGVAGEITCKEIVELVTDYLEFALPEADHVRFERHLSNCAGCTAYLAQMRETIRLTGSLTEESLTLTARASLLEAFRDWRRS